MVESCKNIKLSIASRYEQKPENEAAIQEEMSFFKSNLSGIDFTFLEKTTRISTYKYIDEADIVVCIDSFVGYESIGRSNKTAMVSIRGEFINEESYKFGWGSEINDFGLFWMNKASETNFIQIIDFLINTTNNEWEEYMDEVRFRFCCYDSANELIKDKIDSYLSL